MSPDPFSCLNQNRNSRQSAEIVRSVTEDCLREAVAKSCGIAELESLGLGNTLCESEGVFVYGGVLVLSGNADAPTEDELQSCIAQVVESVTCLDMMQKELSDVESIAYNEVQGSAPDSSPVAMPSPTLLPNTPSTTPTTSSATRTPVAPVQFFPTTKAPSVQNISTQCTEEEQALNDCVSKNMACFDCLAQFRGIIMSCSNLQDNLCNATLQESCDCQECSTEIAEIYNCGGQCGTFSCSSSNNGDSDGTPTTAPTASSSTAATSLPTPILPSVTDVPVVPDSSQTEAPAPDSAPEPPASPACANAQSEFSVCLTKHQNCFDCLEPIFGKTFACDVLGDGMCAAIQNKTCACDECTQSIKKYYDCVGLDKCDPFECTDHSAVSASSKENNTNQSSHVGAIGAAVGGFMVLAVLAFAFVKKREKVTEIDSLDEKLEVPSNSYTPRQSWLQRSFQRNKDSSSKQIAIPDTIAPPVTSTSPVVCSLTGKSQGVARESSYEVRPMLNQDDVLVVSDSDDDIERSKSSLILISTVPYNADDKIAHVTPEHGARAEATDNMAVNRRSASLASSELNTADFEPDESWNPDDTSMGPVDEASVAVTGAGELAFHPLKSPARPESAEETIETKSSSPYTEFFRKFLPKTPSCCDDNTLPIVSPQEVRTSELR